MNIDEIAAFSLFLQLMKATFLAESSFISSFHSALSAPVMSTDVSQVGVALFPSFNSCLFAACFNRTGL